MTTGNEKLKLKSMQSTFKYTYQHSLGWGGYKLKDAKSIRNQCSFFVSRIYGNPKADMSFLKNVGGGGIDFIERKKSNLKEEISWQWWNDRSCFSLLK